jgi:hypothetical protein
VSLRIFPATELHLLPNTAVDFQYAAHAGGQWTNLTSVAGISLQLRPLPAFLALNGRQLTASAEGQVVTRFAIQQNGADLITAPMRIAVHRQLRRLFLALPAITLRTNRSDRVVTVYGEFAEPDGSLVTADITSHPYLRYAPAVAGQATVHVDASGRLTTGAAAGDVDVAISVDSTLNQPAPAVTLTVHVTDEVTDRPILDRFHTGTAVRKKAILFLSDGFVTAQKTEFETLARDVGTKLLSAISPYRHLREAFDLYRAFLPSSEDGCTIAPPVLVHPHKPSVAFSVPTDQPIAQSAALLETILGVLGHPATSAAQTIAAARQQLGAALQVANTAALLPQDLFDLWQSLRTPPPITRLRETFFGLMVGDRTNGTAAVMEQVPLPAGWPPLDAAIFKPSTPIRTVVFDDRRLPDLLTNDPNTAHQAAFSAFLRTLRRPDGPQGEGAIWVPPQAGSTDGDSFGLVVILLRTDHYSGVRNDSCLLMSIGPGMQHQVAASATVPRLLEVVPVPRPISQAQRALGFNQRPLDSLLDVVAHELGHADALGGMSDEYADSNRGRASAANQGDITFVENAPNSQMLANARAGAGPGLDGTRIKWNWERVDGAARVESITVAGNDTIAIEIIGEHAVRLPTLDAGRLLLLRDAQLDRPAPRSPLTGTLTVLPAPQGLNLVSFDIAAQRLVCRILGGTPPATVANTFPVGSVLVVPRLFAGATVTVIPALIAADLAANGPFSPSSAQCQPAQPAARAIQGFHYPANQLRAVAAYEVGAGFHCGAIRPCGECKMRTVVQLTEPPVDFCYVCKYAMTFAVDPSQLPAIDTEYP